MSGKRSSKQKTVQRKRPSSRKTGAKIISSEVLQNYLDLRSQGLDKKQAQLELHVSQRTIERYENAISNIVDEFVASQAEDGVVLDFILSYNTMKKMRMQNIQELEKLESQSTPKDPKLASKLFWQKKFLRDTIFGQSKDIIAQNKNHVMFSKYKKYINDKILNANAPKNEEIKH